MNEKEKHYDLHELLEEIRSTEGLPEGLSTEAQLWDEIMKKETFLMPEQLFPLIKEIYGKSYEKNTAISPLATEFSVQRADTKEITSIRADITVLVEQQDIYHFECEISNDGTMVIRMFEYDVHIALSYPEQSGRKGEYGTEKKGWRLRFPYSAVLYLQENGNIPDKLSCMIQFQDGGSYEYMVPVLKVQSYSLEEIKAKHLCVLIPFLPLRFRRKMQPERKQCHVTKEELTSFYEQLILLLEEEVKGGYLSENNRNMIIDLLNKSLIRVFYRNEELLKEVVEMTEPILELEFEKYVKIIDEQTKRLNEKERVMNEQEQELSRKDEEIREKDEELRGKDEELRGKDEELRGKDEELRGKDEELRGKDEELREKAEELQEHQKVLEEKNRALLEKDVLIEQLLKKLEKQE